MSDFVTVDARGLGCPQPALMARDALGALKGGTVEVLVDSGTARDNVSRVAERAGWVVAVEAQPEGVFRLVLKR